MVKTKKNSQLIERIIRYILAFAVLWILGSFIYSSIVGLMTKTMTIGQAIIETVYSPYGIMIYDNYCIKAPLSGEGEAITPENTRVRKNEAVFRVTATSGTAMQSQTSKTMYAPVSGVVSYQIDGYENISSPEEILALDLATIYETERKTSDEKILAKEGINYAKIINNLDDIFFYIDCEKNSHTETFAVNERYRIRFPEIAYSTLCRVIEIYPYQKSNGNEIEERLLVHVDMGTAAQDIFKHRVWQVELPYNVANVIEIPKEAVVYHENEAGVYELDKGFAYWRSITISLEKENTVVVEDLPEGTEIVTTPKFVQEGEFVKAR